jgi:hypothetical protein
VKDCFAGAARAAAQSLEPRILRADGSLTVSIGDAALPSAQFTEADGTAVIVSMRGGTASLQLVGDGLSQAVQGRELIVSGSGIALAAVAATGTTRRSVMTITGSGGDGRVAVGAITSDGPLKRMSGEQVVLTGTLTAGGPVRRLRLLRTENATIQLGAGTGTSSLAITDAAMDTDVTSVAPVARFDLGSFGGVDGGDVITAPSIDRMIVAGVFQGDIAVSSAGTLDLGVVQSTRITVSESVRVLRAMTASDLRADIAGSIGSVRFVYLWASRIYVGVRPLPEEAPVPASVADFISPSRIGSVWIGAADTTSNTVIAGRFINRVFVGRVPDDRGDWQAYVVADRIARMTGTILMASKYQRRVSARALEDETQDLGSFEVRAI